LAAASGGFLPVSGLWLPLRPARAPGMQPDLCFFMFRFVPGLFSDSTEQLSKTPSFARRLQAKSGVAVYTGKSLGSRGPTLAGAEDDNLFARDLECSLEFVGKMLDFIENFLRLLGQVIDHAVDHVRFPADQFQRGDHQGKMIVDVVPQVRKFPIQVSHLFRTERHVLAGQTHAAYDGVPCCRNQAGLTAFASFRNGQFPWAAVSRRPGAKTSKGSDPFRFRLTPRLAKTTLLFPDLMAATGNACPQDAQVAERT